MSGIRSFLNQLGGELDLQFRSRGASEQVWYLKDEPLCPWCSSRTTGVPHVSAGR